MDSNEQEFMLSDNEETDFTFSDDLTDEEYEDDEPEYVCTEEELLILIDDNKTVNNSVIICFEYLESLKDVEKIDGNLELLDSNVKDLGNLKEITGDFRCDVRNVFPVLTDLGNLETVGGELNLRDLQIKSLGNVKRVGKNLNLRNTPIEDLGNLEYVGGNILLHTDFKGVFDFTNVVIEGKIKYFKDKLDRLSRIPISSEKLIKPEMPVPLWKLTYSNSSKVLDSASSEQKEFYFYFKDGFADGKYVNVRGNTNYIFILLAEMLEEFYENKNLILLTHQLNKISRSYPLTKHYAEDYIIKASEGKLTPPEFLETSIFGNSTLYSDIDDLDLEFVEIEDDLD